MALGMVLLYFGWPDFAMTSQARELINHPDGIMGRRGACRSGIPAMTCSRLARVRHVPSQ